MASKILCPALCKLSFLLKATTDDGGPSVHSGRLNLTGSNQLSSGRPPSDPVTGRSADFSQPFSVSKGSKQKGLHPSLSVVLDTR